MALAAERGVANVRFEQGSVYDLPFPAAAFDAAFSRSVLEHLANPVKALREVRRVLKPDGVIGVAKRDFCGNIVAPPRPLVEEAYALYARVWEWNGATRAAAASSRRCRAQRATSASRHSRRSLEYPINIENFMTAGRSGAGAS